MSGNFTEKELEAIEELRTSLKDELTPVMYEDVHLMHNFLKARNFKINQAVEMLRKHIGWRKIIQIDDIMEYKAPEILKRYVSTSFFGYDKEGCPVRYSAIGNLDGAGLFKSANKIDVLKICLQAIETDIRNLRLQTKKLQRPVKQCVYIYDMQNFSLAKATDKASLTLFLIGLNIFQDNYPELLKAVYIINAQSYFALVFPIVKTILSGSVINKVKILGKDWKEELVRVIDADVLPAFLGGNRTDPDGNPDCETFINFAGTVPEKYYLTKNIEIFANKPGVKKATVERQSSFKEKVNVPNPSSILEWEFETKCYDIGFRLLFDDTDSDEIKELIPFHSSHPFETEYGPVTGKLKCKKPGTYIIVFDNSYSWFHSKEIYYRIQVKVAETD